MDKFGFSASALKRLMLVGCYAAATFVAVLFVESRADSSQEIVAQTQPPERSAHVKVEAVASFDVESWSVECGGNKMEASTSDARKWMGEFNATSQELLIVAQGGTTGGASEEALRVRVDCGGESRDYTVWGAFSIAARIDLDELRKP